MASHAIEKFEVVGNLTAVNTGTANIAASALGYSGKAAVDFDKVDVGTNSTCGVYATYSAPTKPYGSFGPSDYVELVFDPQDLTNIASVSVRIGTNATNYLTWTWADSTLTADRWNLCTARLGAGTPTLLGCDFGNIGYLAVIVTFDATTNTLADMHVARVSLLEAGDA